MKRLIIALAIFAGSAQAEEWFEMPNQAGGKILLLTAQCPDTKSGRLVISTISDGQTIRGCWYFFAEMIHIVWDHGDHTSNSSFKPSSFTYRKRGDGKASP